MFIVKCYLSFVYIVCSYHPNSNGNLLFPEKFCEVSENFFFTQKQSEASCTLNLLYFTEGSTQSRKLQYMRNEWGIAVERNMG